MLRISLYLMLTMFWVGSVDADIYKYVTDDGVIVYTDLPSDPDASLVMKSREHVGTDKKIEGRLYERIQKYYPIVKRVAEEYSVDPELVKAIISVESRWKPTAISRKGAMGLMQLMPGTAESLSVRNPYDPEENITGGIEYFRMLLDLFNGNLRNSLAAYNAGPTRVKRNTYFAQGSETRQYVEKVLALYGKEENFEYMPLRPALHYEKVFKLVLDDGTLLFTNTPLPSQGESF